MHNNSSRNVRQLNFNNAIGDKSKPPIGTSRGGYFSNLDVNSSRVNESTCLNNSNKKIDNFFSCPVGEGVNDESWDGIFQNFDKIFNIKLDAVERPKPSANELSVTVGGNANSNNWRRNLQREFEAIRKGNFTLYYLKELIIMYHLIE